MNIGFSEKEVVYGRLIEGEQQNIDMALVDWCDLVNLDPESIPEDDFAKMDKEIILHVGEWLWIEEYKKQATMMNKSGVAWFVGKAEHKSFYLFGDKIDVDEIGLRLDVGFTLAKDSELEEAEKIGVCTGKWIMEFNA